MSKPVDPQVLDLASSFVDDTIKGYPMSAQRREAFCQRLAEEMQCAIEDYCAEIERACMELTCPWCPNCDGAGERPNGSGVKCETCKGTGQLE
jgi:DnaJ-class molecular chaperone